MSSGRFQAEDGTPLDIIVNRAPSERGFVLLYPCIGGTTRAYMVPYHEILALGLSLIEYHPRAHGRSKGQMSMEAAQNDLYFFLATGGWLRLPCFAVGHSAGANALLRLHNDIVQIRQYFLLQPVLDYRESVRFMYSNGRCEEFIEKIDRWVDDTDELRRILRDPTWQDPQAWFSGRYKHKLNELSTSFLQLGSFLEDSYVPGSQVFAQFQMHAAKSRLFLTENDNWYPTSTTRRLAHEFNVDVTPINNARDHYFLGGWTEVWQYILDDITRAVGDD